MIPLSTDLSRMDSAFFISSTTSEAFAKIAFSAAFNAFFIVSFVSRLRAFLFFEVFALFIPDPPVDSFDIASSVSSWLTLR